MRTVVIVVTVLVPSLDIRQIFFIVFLLLAIDYLSFLSVIGQIIKNLIVATSTKYYNSKIDGIILISGLKMPIIMVRMFVKTKEI